MINKVMFAVAVNDPKPMLNGVYFCDQTATR